MDTFDDTNDPLTAQQVATLHPELPGAGLPIGVVGEPPVTLLEEWQDETDVLGSSLQFRP